MILTKDGWVQDMSYGLVVELKLLICQLSLGIKIYMVIV